MRSLIIVLAVAACAQSSNAVVQGQLFCQTITTLQPQIKKIATTNNVPVSVIGKSKDEVAAICALINAIPVPPPADADTVPTAPVAKPNA